MASEDKIQATIRAMGLDDKPETPGRRTKRDSLCDNRHLNGQVKSQGDFLYHFGLGTMTHDLKEEFGDVRFVLMGGSSSRMLKMAKLLQEQLDVSKHFEPRDLASQGGRYSLYKVGPVICVNHNIGASTLSVVLHEVFKLIDHAEVPREKVHFIRLGTSGGLGVEPGTVVITNTCIDAVKRNHFHSAECGRLVTLPCKIDVDSAEDIYKVAQSIGIPSVLGGTMGTDDFYLGQGRLDGAFCTYSKEDKFSFIQDLHDNYGIRNIEMEAHILSAFTHRAGVRCSIVCVTLLNRLLGDQVTSPKAMLKDFEARPLTIMAEYIKLKTQGMKK